MAVPFRRVSSTRRNKRRTHDKLSAPTLVVCPECGEYKMSHRVCKHCGTYKGKKVHIRLLNNRYKEYIMVV